MSATLPNLKVLSDWLNASLFETNYRPIELNEYYKFDKSIYDKNSTNVRTIKIDERIEKEDKELVTHLVLETIMEKLGVFTILRIFYNTDASFFKKNDFSHSLKGIMAGMVPIL